MILAGSVLKGQRQGQNWASGHTFPKMWQFIGLKYIPMQYRKICFVIKHFKRSYKVSILRRHGIYWKLNIFPLPKLHFKPVFSSQKHVNTKGTLSIFKCRYSNFPTPIPIHIKLFGIKNCTWIKTFYVYNAKFLSVPWFISSNISYAPWNQFATWKLDQ